MKKIQIIKTSIIQLETDAIVNSASENLKPNGGICRDIFKAAGMEELQEACETIGYCATGDAVITSGFKLKNKYIIHAVAPKWIDGRHNESLLLYNVYQNALELATKNNCHSIAFPLLSTGANGYQIDKAWTVAIEACTDFQKKLPDQVPDIIFAVINENAMNTGKKIMEQLRKEKTVQYLSELDQNGIRNIKGKLIESNKLLIDGKENPSAAGLLGVLCEENVINSLSTEQLGCMLESIFPDCVYEEVWLSKYCDMLIKILDDNKKSRPQGRALKYENYLREVLVPALKEGTHSKDIWDDLEPLTDVYKTIVCLYRYYTKREKSFSFGVELSDMEEFNSRIFDVQGLGNQFLGVYQFPVWQRERQYALVLSWLIEEFLCEEEGIEGGSK